MPEVTDSDKKAVKARVKDITDYLKDSTDKLAVYPNTLGEIEGAISNLERRIYLQPGQFGK